MHFAVAVTAAVLLAAGTAGTARAAEGPPELFGGFSFTSRKDPIEVSADRLDFDYKKRRTVFHGGVAVTQGDIHLTSDALTVEYEEAGDQQKLRQVEAEGNVVIIQGGRKATGERARFDETSRTLVLTGRAMLEEGANQLNGDTIIVYPDESRMEVKGEHSRVKLLLFPRAAGTPTPGTGTDGAPQSP